MKYEIEYHTIESDSIFATPALTSSEIVEADSPDKLREYIESKKDGYGHPFVFEKNPFQGFQYISKLGGVKVKQYKPPKIKKL